MPTSVMQTQPSGIPTVPSTDRKRVSLAQAYWDEARKVITVAETCLSIGKLSEKARLRGYPCRHLLGDIYQHCKDGFYEQLDSTAIYYGAFTGYHPDYTFDDAEEFYLHLIDDSAYRQRLYDYCTQQINSRTPVVPRLLMLV